MHPLYEGLVYGYFTPLQKEYPHDEVTWERLWDLIASMESLRFLDVQLGSIATIDPDRWRIGPDVIKPLCAVQQTETFRLKLYQTVNDSQGLWKDGKFTVYGLEVECSGEQ